MAMTIVNQSETGITYTLFAASASGAASGSKGSGSKDSGGSKGSGSPKGTASGVASGVKASGADSYTIAHDWMQAPGHTLSVSGG